MNIKSFVGSLRNRSRLFIALGVVTLLLRFVLGFMPEVVEIGYSRGIFLGIRYVLDYTVGWCPFPFSYVVILGILAWWVVKWRRNRGKSRGQEREQGLEQEAGQGRGRELKEGSGQERKEGLGRKRKAFRARLKLAALNVGGFFGAAVFFFYFLWGFNYQRVPIEQQLGLQLDSLSVETLCLEAEWAARRAEVSRAEIVGITEDSVSMDLVPVDLETEIRGCVGRCLSQMGYAMHGRIRGRVIVPGGWMLRIGISGIYNPFTGEGNVSGNQTPQRIPFTMAHEMSHACGFGDEGTCNFIGMVACELSDDPFVRYSGQMGYWGHVISTLGEADPLMAKMLVATFDKGVKADLRANYNNYVRYHGAIAEIGNRVNNAYLHAQGVDGGIKSYDRVVGLRAAWHASTGH